MQVNTLSTSNLIIEKPVAFKVAAHKKFAGEALSVQIKGALIKKIPFQSRRMRASR